MENDVEQLNKIIELLEKYGKTTSRKYLLFTSQLDDPSIRFYNNLNKDTGEARENAISWISSFLYSVFSWITMSIGREKCLQKLSNIGTKAPMLQSKRLNKKEALHIYR